MTRLIEKMLIDDFKETVQASSNIDLDAMKLDLTKRLESIFGESNNAAIHKSITQQLLYIIKTEQQYRNQYNNGDDGTYDDYMDYLKNLYTCYIPST